jgi:methylmalonyl-CoA mutase N-terminal domain/subunit
MPIKPWMLRPKQSLKVFEGLGNVLDAREQRQQTLEDRLARDQDRKAQADSRSLEDRLRQMQIDKMNNPEERWDRFEGEDGFYEQNQRTREVRPVTMDGQRVRGNRPAARVDTQTDAERLNTRIRELVKEGRPLDVANAQARQEYGYAPPRPRTESPAAERREKASEIRAGETEVRSLRGQFQSVLGRRPKQSQYVDPLTRMADTTAFNEAMPNWRADSTEVHNSLKSAQDELTGLKPAPSPTAGGGGRAGGGNPRAQTTSKKPMSATDREKARKDPAFAAWLRANGYDVDGPPR